MALTPRERVQPAKTALERFGQGLRHAAGKEMSMKSVQSRIESLASDHRQNYELHFGEHAVSDPEEVGDEVLSFIMLTPRLVEQVQRWNALPGMPTEVKRLHGFLLGYLYHDRDLVPEDRMGLFGYIDDAYFAGRVYQLTERAAFAASPDRARHDLLDVSAKMPGWIQMVGRVVPKASRRIDDAIDDLLVGREEAFSGIMAA